MGSASGSQFFPLPGGVYTRLLSTLLTESAISTHYRRVVMFCAEFELSGGLASACCVFFRPSSVPTVCTVLLVSVLVAIRRVGRRVDRCSCCVIGYECCGRHYCCDRSYYYYTTWCKCVGVCACVERFSSVCSACLLLAVCGPCMFSNDIVCWI